MTIEAHLAGASGNVLDGTSRRWTDGFTVMVRVADAPPDSPACVVTFTAEGRVAVTIGAVPVAHATIPHVPSLREEATARMRQTWRSIYLAPDDEARQLVLEAGQEVYVKHVGPRAAECQVKLGGGMWITLHIPVSMLEQT